MNTLLREEIEQRVSDMEFDPDFMLDNPDMSHDDRIRFALECVVDLDTDCGGAFEGGIRPTIICETPAATRAAQKRQAESIAEESRQHAAWKKLRVAAMRELRKREATV